MLLKRIRPSLALNLANFRLYNRNLAVKSSCCHDYHTGVETNNENLLHVPVMAETVIKYLEPKSSQTFIDMTFGAGGHTRKILDFTSNTRVIAVDRDPVAHKLANELADKYPGRVIPVLGRFSELPNFLKERNIRQNSIDGILFDFGCSSMQFDVAHRGFSASKDGPLDMRMDGFRFPNDPTAADVLARAEEEDLRRIIKIYGEEKQARKIARAIIEVRYSFKKLETTLELVQLINSVMGDEERQDQLGRFASNATKTFQAFRIFVNNELNEINYGMLIAEKYLKFGGRLITIAFHSLEDTIVKRHISGNISENRANALPLRYMSHGVYHNKNDVESLMHSSWEMLHKHVITPSDEEVGSNPRSRSAKFRAAICVK